MCLCLLFSTRQKKVVDLCKTQQKVYDTFADELSDYIQIQKARGINPRLPALPPKDGQQEENSKGEDVSSRADNVEVTGFVTNVSLNYNPPHRSPIGSYSPAARCPPPHLDIFRPSHSLDYSSPLPLMRQKRRKPSSSSSSASSSSYSSSDSSTSDSEHRSEKRRGERTKRNKCEESEKEKSRKWWNREKLSGSEERRRKTSKGQDRQRGQDRRHQVEDAKPVPKERGMDEPSRNKNRKEKKKIKGDTRTEEERLWDDSILGF